MQNKTNDTFWWLKHATVIQCKDGVATLRVHTDNDGCEGCGGSKQSICALYTFGAIFSRHRDIWQVPTKHLFESGTEVRLAIHSDTLLKVAAFCYGLPVAMLVITASVTHLLLGMEWLTAVIGLGSVSASYLLIKRWLFSLDLFGIQLTR